MDNKKRIAQSLETMKWKDHLLYWGYPVIICLILMLFYFQGPLWLQELAAPAYNREFGLVENVQNVFLLLTAFMGLRLLVIPHSGWLKLAYLLIFLTATFTLLEEIDYGYHYINYFNDADAAQRSINHNIHNIGNTNNYLRLAFYILIAIFIIIMPYLPSARLPSLLTHFVPDIRMQLSVLAMLVISKMAGIFNDLSTDTNLALKGNISEFEELPLYYLLLLYVYKLYRQEYNIFSTVSHRPVKQSGLFNQIHASE